MSRRAMLKRICAEYGVLAVYTFGSRAGDGPHLLGGDPVSREGSDLDVGVVFQRHDFALGRLGALQADLEDVFEPLRVDLVPLQRVDAIFQYHAIEGHRVYSGDATRTAFYELDVMSRAADLVPIQRQLEIDVFGVATT
ncbi:MAG TPA: nucleotidyltransferase domain-containing protein [Planctomycetota bacterium]|nr:nucleotidyltransferase domain-containing protein [Planctomycetota bacterium]